LTIYDPALTLLMFLFIKETVLFRYEPG
jgi:hypothetical protein